MEAASGERRIVSVLIADVAGSTAIAERLGPERSKFLFDEVVGLMSEQVRHFEGTVAQLTGDGVLALFGAPTAHEDDPERAVRAALGLHEALSSYAREIGEAYGVEVQARVAVNTGPVVIPAHAAPPDVLYNALGDTVNVAARLQEAAGPGGVALGPTTARQVERTFELEGLGELALKGKSEPVIAMRVVGPAAATPSRVQLFVGREQELGALCQVLDGLVELRGSVVSITGEAGIGKTRLSTEARRRYENRALFLEAACVSYATGVPYAPVRELLRSWLGLGLADPEARVRLELKAELERLLGTDAADAYPFLGNLLGVSLERETEQRLAEYARDSVKRQTHEAVAQVVRALAGERPLCLLLEDLHWADEPTLELLEELLPLTDEAPLCVLLLHRADPDKPSRDLADRARRRYRHRYLELELAPLSPGETAQLAAGSAGAAPAEELATLLAERSGGNPLFLEEIVSDLLERGALRRENGRLRLADGVGTAVPTLVQEALQARLDRLPPETREVVSLGAVVGRRFTLPLLERLEARERLLPALSELQRLDLVVEERRRPAPEYRFRHGLVQEAAYATLTSAGRRALHRKVASALEELVAEEPERAYPALARHYAEADEPEKAAGYLLKAGDGARTLYADEEAVSHYRRALDFLDRLGDAGRARQTLFKIALTHHQAFAFEQANAAWQEAFARPEPPPVRLEPTERIETAVDPHESPVPGYAYSAESWWLAQHLFRGLLTVNRELDVVPDLAAGFEVSGDGLRYRFRLREGPRWSDGAPVTAEDFSSAWRLMSEERAPTAYLLADVGSADTRDARTLEIRLREPRNYLLHVLAQPPAFPWPKHVVERLGTDWGEAEPLVGNGPFVLARHDDRRLVLDASRTWNGARGNVGRVGVTLEATRVFLEDAWLAGHADVLPSFYAAKAPEALPQTIQEQRGGMATWYVGFRADVEPFSDELVRRAFAHAFDRDRFLAALPDLFAQPARGGIIGPALPTHSHRLALEPNIELARQLLSEAGYPGGRGLPTLRLVGPDVHASSARELAAQLAALGAEVEVILASIPAMQDSIRSAQAWCFGWTPDFPDPDGVLASLLETYPFLARDEEIEALIRRARSARSQDERMRLYREAERRWIVELAALVPIVYPGRVLLLRPWVEGLWLSPLAPATLDHAVVRRPR